MSCMWLARIFQAKSLGARRTSRRRRYPQLPPAAADLDAAGTMKAQLFSTGGGACSRNAFPGELLVEKLAHL